MPFQLPAALAISLLLHAAVLWWNVIELRPPPTPRLQASLQPLTPPGPASDEPLLKNTLSSDPSPAAATAPPRPATAPAAATTRAVARRQIEAAQRKLSQHLYYPPEAVARGIEGEVRLLVRLADDGSIIDVQLAASSGHAILDQAAVKAAYAMGRANWAQSRELILPVIFRLQ